MKTDRRFVVTMLAPTFFFLICFYVLSDALQHLQQLHGSEPFRLAQGWEWIGLENYWELVTSRGFRSVLFNTVIWLTVIGVTVRIVLGLLSHFCLQVAR